MRTLSLQCLCLFALLACAPQVHAQATQPIHRCIGAHGEPEFSGQPCATPAPAPGGAPSASPASGAGSVCAASPQALRQATAGAFAAHDVNQLSGLVLWRGTGQASARATLQSLARWLRQPLTGIVFTPAARPPDFNAGALPAAASTAPAATQPPTGLNVSTGGDAGGTRDFGIVRSGDCWWLTF